ncbi:hypothetical protein [Streptomyces sp. S.PB5]|uniref:hypothetical protein n=1 Tax=Streptomyces sp. S.PB5 TaxID=3020844 RepID=UPI0025AFA617|nr:hypothetical protein [Streptomyces sp. S.PB5]MDN3026189.1 hypothetical protein [Streptomyces sp. S.PB5]
MGEVNGCPARRRCCSSAAHIGLHPDDAADTAYVMAGWMFVYYAALRGLELLAE